MSHPPPNFSRTIKGVFQKYILFNVLSKLASKYRKTAEIWTKGGKNIKSKVHLGPWLDRKASKMLHLMGLNNFC